MKWSTTTSTHDRINVGDAREMNGHDLEKCCRYTTWHTMPNARCQNGKPSKMYSKACKTMMTCGLEMRGMLTHVDGSHADGLGRPRVLLNELGDPEKTACWMSENPVGDTHQATR